LKESDLFLTFDTWRVALDFNLSTYHEIIATGKDDLFSVEQQKQKFTSVSELKLKHNCKFWSAHLLICRRSILGIGGTILRTLFGIWTHIDLHKLHNTLDELKDKNSDLVHSLSK
jgi:hypothetical protein